MDEATARWLVSPAAAEALALAGAEADPASVAAATRLRRRFPPQQAAAALAQAELRRRAVDKVGDAAASRFFTSAGLEQATRPAVAAWRAHRFVAAGVTSVLDLGCGLGHDAIAFADAGLDVTAVERDPVTALLAESNLAGRGRVVAGDAIAEYFALARPGVAVFCDPARRNERGRTWRVADFTPPWDFVLGLLDGARPAAVKLGPGLPVGLIPDRAAATWVSEHGDLVEASLWAGGPWSPGDRQAVLLPEGWTRAGSSARIDPTPLAGPVEAGQVLYEPDPAVIRAGAVPALAQDLAAGRIASDIAYLVAADAVPTPFATAFVVRDVLDFSEKVLRAWVREHEAGTLEIKKRGLDVDPAELRRRLRPSGKRAATLVLSPTAAGAKALVVERISRS